MDVASQLDSFLDVKMEMCRMGDVESACEIIDVFAISRENLIVGVLGYTIYLGRPSASLAGLSEPIRLFFTL